MTKEITSDEIQRMKKLAENASAGPWYSQHHRVCDDDGVDICGVASTRGRYEYELANRDFIATANPAFVLALIAKVEYLEADAEPIELKGVQEQIDESSGFWRSCSGCLETEGGYPVGRYPYSNVFKCQLGNGCSECGGIGAVWDNIDYEAMAKEPKQ